LPSTSWIEYLTVTGGTTDDDTCILMAQIVNER
jgi:hypothetical protein